MKKKGIKPIKKWAEVENGKISFIFWSSSKKEIDTTKKIMGSKYEYIKVLITPLK